MAMLERIKDTFTVAERILCVDKLNQFKQADVASWEISSEVRMGAGPMLVVRRRPPLNPLKVIAGAVLSRFCVAGCGANRPWLTTETFANIP